MEVFISERNKVNGLTKSQCTQRMCSHYKIPPAFSEKQTYILRQVRCDDLNKHTCSNIEKPSKPINHSD